MTSVNSNSNSNRQASEEENQVDVLAEEFTQRLRNGESPAIEEYINRAPELEDEIRELFPTILALEQMRIAKDQPPEPLGFPDQLGDFRLIREIGRGGMGIVYEAIQISLDRQVAVKVLPPHRMDDVKSLRRFEREARTAARLHHTNIVSVLGVGHERDQHYFVMQYIEGTSLERIISQLQDMKADASPDMGTKILRPQTQESNPTSPGESDSGFSPSSTWELESDADADTAPMPAQEADKERPGFVDSYGALEPSASYFQTVAVLGRQVAQALEYAHSQGVLHRDIKPANLILDQQGQLWVADFGLAKFVEHDTVSRTGDIVGTLRYMAPEQFRGQANAQSDIYSLGITLYELTTLEPGHSRTNAKQRLEFKTNPELVPPRKFNPAIPRDLETILLKATAVDQQDRYQSAGELALDLGRFLEDRPLATRRASWIERTIRWCRRNPALASLSVLAMVLTGLVIVVASLGYFSTKQALAEESRQRERAETTLKISLAALERVYQRLAPEGLSELATKTDSEGNEIPLQPALSPETAALLEELLEFYDQLAEQEINGRTLAGDIAKANRRVGDIHRQLGNHQKSLNAYANALQQYEQLEAADENASHHMALARIHNAMGRVYWQLQDRENANTSHLAALELFNQQARETPGKVNVQYELARTYYYLGRGPDRQSVPPPEHGPPRRDGFHPPRDREPNRNFDRPPPRREDEDPPPRNEPPPRPEDRRALDYAIGLLEDLTRDHPQEPRYQFLLAVCYRDAHPPGSSREHDRAIEILSQLVKNSPLMGEYRYELAETLLKFDERRFPPNEKFTSESRLREALKHAEQLVLQSPHQPNSVMLLVQVQHRLAMWLRRPLSRENGRSGPEVGREIEDLSRSALRHQQELVKRFPNTKGYQVWLTKLEETLAEHEKRKGDFAPNRDFPRDLPRDPNRRRNPPPRR